MGKEVSPQKKKVVYLICSIIIAFTVFVCTVIIMSALLSTSLVESETSVTEESPKVDTASFDEIYHAYKENEIVADEAYKGNRYRVTGKIAGISNDGLLNLGGGATLTLNVELDNVIVVLIASFDETQIESLKSVKVGDTTTFTGKCLSYGSWSDCELVLEE